MEGSAMTKLRLIILTLTVTAINTAHSAPLPKEPQLTSQSGGEESSGVEVIAASDSSIISLTHKNAFSRASQDGKSQDWFYKATLSSPVDKKEDLDPFANLEGITKGLEFKSEVEWWKNNSRKRPSAAELKVKDALCDKAVKAYETQKGEGVDDKDEKCENLEFRAKYMNIEDFYKWDSLFWEDKLDWGLGGIAKIGHETYDFSDPEDYSDKDSTETPWAAGAYYIASFRAPWINNYIPGAGEFTPGVLVIGGLYEETYKEKDEQTLCLDLSTIPVSCKSYKLGGPDREQSKLFYAEYRSFIKNTAFSIRLTHDFENHNDGVDIPIFLFRDKDSNWSGGIRVGWTKDKDEQFALFVGKSFDLYAPN